MPAGHLSGARIWRKLFYRMEEINIDEQGEIKRRINERKFGSWEELPGSGRRYSYKVEGRQGWTARYVKEVHENNS